MEACRRGCWAGHSGGGGKGREAPGNILAVGFI